MLYLSLITMFCFLAKSFDCIIRNEPHSILWVCCLANLVESVGIYFQSPLIVGIGFLWITWGLALWSLDLLSGAPIRFASVLTHFGGSICGYLFLKETSLPSSTWIWATIIVLLLQEFCRHFTPEHLNINISHSIWEGWEDNVFSKVKFGTFSNYFIYRFLCCLLTTFIYFITEQICFKFLFK